MSHHAGLAPQTLPSPTNLAKPASFNERELSYIKTALQTAHAVHYTMTVACNIMA